MKYNGDYVTQSDANSGVGFRHDQGTSCEPDLFGQLSGLYETTTGSMVDTVHVYGHHDSELMMSCSTVVAPVSGDGT